MTARVFVDTNIWFYASTKSDDARSARANQLLDSLARPVINGQVILELGRILLVKAHCDEAIIQRLILDLIPRLRGSRRFRACISARQRTANGRFPQLLGQSYRCLRLRGGLRNTLHRGYAARPSHWWPTDLGEPIHGRVMSGSGAEIGEEVETLLAALEENAA